MPSTWWRKRIMVSSAIILLCVWSASLCCLLIHLVVSWSLSCHSFLVIVIPSDIYWMCFLFSPIVTSEMFPLEGRGEYSWASVRTLPKSVICHLYTCIEYCSGYRYGNELWDQLTFSQSFPSILASIKASGSQYIVDLHDLCDGPI